jgi:uncharacterized membrane protein
MSEQPHWRTPHRGELRWPVSLVVLLALALQYLLPEYLRLPGRSIVFTVGVVLLVALFATDPHRIARHQARTRTLSIALVALLTIANIGSVIRLIAALVNGEIRGASDLLVAGGSIWLINVVVFSLWFWELDRGGPGRRAEAIKEYPDFLFPQMTESTLAPRGWHPTYFDYLYLAVTNSTAFSPTDVMPLSRWAKSLMMVQSLVSLITIGLVIARAVNILR